MGVLYNIGLNGKIISTDLEVYLVIKKQRTRYDEEFILRGVRINNSSEQTVKEIADSLGIHPQLLRRWRQLYTPGGKKTKLSEANDELSALRQRIAELKEENYILYPKEHAWKKNPTPSQSGPKH